MKTENSDSSLMSRSGSESRPALPPLYLQDWVQARCDAAVAAARNSADTPLVERTLLGWIIPIF
jgi:hypothetical protein